MPFSPLNCVLRAGLVTMGALETVGTLDSPETVMVNSESISVYSYRGSLASLSWVSLAGSGPGGTTVMDSWVREASMSTLASPPYRFKGCHQTSFYLRATITRWVPRGSWRA